MAFTGTQAAIVLADATNNDINIGTASLIRCTGGGASQAIGGLTGGAAGRVLFVLNVTGSVLGFSEEEAGSTAANRIATTSDPGSPTLYDGGMAMLVYDTTASRWIVVYL